MHSVIPAAQGSHSILIGEAFVGGTVTIHSYSCSLTLFLFFKWRQNWRPRVLFPIADNIMAGGHRLNDMFVAPPQYKHHAFAT